jgi:hypothetical protein
MVESPVDPIALSVFSLLGLMMRRRRTR